MDPVKNALTENKVEKIVLKIFCQSIFEPTFEPKNKISTFFTLQMTPPLTRNLIQGLQIDIIGYTGLTSNEALFWKKSASEKIFPIWPSLSTTSPWIKFHACCDIMSSTFNAFLGSKILLLEIKMLWQKKKWIFFSHFPPVKFFLSKILGRKSPKPRYFLFK